MADKIEQQILNAEKAIDRLTTRINTLKAELESGDWGTQQIKEIQTQLDKLTASLERKVTRRESLIDQKNVQEIETLTKTVETLKAKLQDLNQQRSELANKNLTGTNEFSKLEKDIVNAERALNSFNSRVAAKRLEPSGSYGFDKTVNPESGSKIPAGTRSSHTLPIETPNTEDIQRRINGAVLGLPLTNAEIEAKIEAAKKLRSDEINARQQQVSKATGTPSSISDPLTVGITTKETQSLSETLTALRELRKEKINTANSAPVSNTDDTRLKEVNRSITETINLLRELKRVSIESRGGVVSEQEIAAQEKLNALLKERRELRSDPVSRAQSVLETGANNPANPKIDTSNMSAEARRKLDEINKALGVSTKNLGDAEEVESEKARKAAVEAKRLADARTLVANDPRYKQALEQAGRLGLGVEHLNKIEDRGGGVQSLLFQNQSGGVNTNFRTYVDQTGKATAGLSSQFRSFGSDIVRDIGQFTKWSIAVAAVYTPMQKLGELMSIMVDNESRLADAAVAANVPFSKSAEIFDTVAVSAEKAGEGINTTIDAYTSAIRAAGRYNDEGTKQAAAVKLLDDALVLSKLSTLDQSNAIDTLSAALIQSDRSLTGGTELLNKWVRVSQVANVDITALATGVATLGDSAETVGLSIDQLNGLIAVLSENSISGAKEAANTAKALVGAYQSDKAEAALNKYGIALRKANGEVRGFLDIYQQLSSLRNQGVLSDANVSELSLALGGGGVRRAKDASALINNTQRLNDIAKESASVTGEDTLAQDALSKKLQTVQTANTRLANSFQQLAETLGTDGGLLDDFKVLIGLLTGITKGANELFAVLGRSGPILATFASGLLAIATMSSGRRETALAGLGALGNFKGFLGETAQYGGPRQRNVDQNYGQGVLTDILRLNYRGAGIIGGLGVATQAGTNLYQGRNEQAVANVTGGAIGAAIGAALGGPVGLAAGANIGSAVGEAFVNGVEKHSEQLADYFVPKKKAGEPETKPTTDTYRGKTTTELIDTAYNSLSIFDKIDAYLKSREARPNQNGQYEAFGNKESAALDIVKTKNPALYTELQRQFAAQQAALAPSASLNGVNNTPDAETLKKRQELEYQATAARREQLLKLSAGQIGTAEFGRISNQLSGFPAQSIQSVKAYGEAFQKVSKDVNSTEDAYNAFLYIATNGTQEQINLLSQYSNDIEVLQGALDQLTKNPATVGMKLQLSFGDVTVESKDQLQKMIADLQSQGGTAAAATYTQIRVANQKIPQIVGSATQATTQPDVNLIKQQASKLQEQFYTDMNLTDDEILNLKSKLEDFAVLVGDAAKNHYETISGIDQKFWDAAQKLLEDQGKIQQQNNGIGFQKYDVPIGQLQGLAAQSLQIGQSWKQQYNYDFKPEDQIAIDNQGIVSPLHADFKILALLLQDLNDKAQKQLDGQYNIPEGATFWVPLTAAYYRNKGGDTGGGLQNMLDSLQLADNTGATDNNTTALQNLTEAMQNRKEDIVDKWDSKHFGGGATNKTASTGYDRLEEIRGNRGATTVDRSYDSIENLRSGARGTNSQSALESNYGRGTPTFQGTGLASVLDQVRNFFSTLLQGAGGGGYYKPAGPGGSAPGLLQQSPAGRGGFSGTPSTTTPTTIRLDLKSSANVNLLVDGRVLASTLQSYLASELLRTEQTQGTISRRFIA